MLGPAGLLLLVGPRLGWSYKTGDSLPKPPLFSLPKLYHLLSEVLGDPHQANFLGQVAWKLLPMGWWFWL